MAQIDNIYKSLCRDIIENGYYYQDKSREKRCKQISSENLIIPMTEFPLLTTKKMFTKGIIAELIWFLRGDNNIKYLVDNNVNIWNKDAYNWYKRLHAENYLSTQLWTLEEFIKVIKNTKNLENLEFEELRFIGYKVGDVGQNYSRQWRYYTGDRIQIDQISNLLNNLKDNPINRRNIVTAWNPTEVSETALPPCHWSFEIIPKPLNIKEAVCKLEYDIFIKENPTFTELPKFSFDLKWHQRSVDTFLGLPFNIASYGFLAKIIEGLTSMVSENIIGDLSNVHFYEPHIEKAEKQLKRNPNMYTGCQIEFSKKASNLFSDFRKNKISFDYFILNFDIEDIIIKGYDSFPPLKGEMFAPIK